MKPLVEFSIPIKGLSLGIHEYKFQISNKFFEHFESSYIKKGEVQADLYVDKRSRSYNLTFEVSGQLEVPCDRCLEPFFKEIQTSQQIILNLDKQMETVDDEDVVFLVEDAHEYNVAQHFYEFILLSIPLSKVHADGECAIDIEEILTPEEEEDDNIGEDNPFWSALQQFKKEK